MGAFDQINHQKRAASILQRAILTDRISHAWLFCGPSASDMRVLALAFAAAIQCTRRGPDVADACMECRSCRQAMDGNHPDILVWTHEKARTFSVGEVRALISDVSIRPFESDHKIYIVPDAHLMRDEAQNALLKTLEEPPEYVVLILLAHSADAMLETVRSRCQMVELAAGQVEYDPALRQTAEDVLVHIHAWDLPRISLAVTALSEYKAQVEDVLSIFAGWYRDVLYFKATMDPDGVRCSAYLSEIRTAAENLSYNEVQYILDSIRNAGRRFRANVNFDLTMELLMLSMKEPMTG